jgi:TctA family transporter
MCALLGVLGYTIAKLECEPAPLILGYVLGPLMEENLRRALLISRGDPTVFFTRPISLSFMILTAFIFFIMVAPAIRKKKEEAYTSG